MPKRLKAAYDSIRSRTDFVPETAIVLGSGLGGFAKKVKNPVIIDYNDIEGFPVSGVEGHEGRLLLGKIEEKRVAVMQGRVHYYEGFSPDEVVLPIRVMGLLGAKRLILTNAAGGINPSLSAGSLMLISDHISFFVPSPLRGENIPLLGPRFPDMTEVYSARLRNIAKTEAEELGITLHEGVYAQLSGPNYETPAEIRALSVLGADAVGMSTACEAIAARHMGIECCGISCITNLAAGVGSSPLSHDEVQQTADRVGREFSALLTALIKNAGNADE